MTDKPTYSRWKKVNRNIVGGKPKASACHFFRFATVQIADKKHVLTLYAMHCKKGMNNKEIVERLVRESM